VPVRVVAGLANPELAYRGIAATERRLRRSLSLPANATATQRLDFVEERVGDLFLLMPRTVAYAVGGLLMLVASRRLLRDVAEPGELQEVLRGLPHNVTTEMDLKLWELTEQIRNDERCCSATGTVLCHPLRSAASRHFCAATVIALSPRSTSACRDGPMIRVICSE
jgi:pyruvate,water dikinase